MVKALRNNSSISRLLLVVAIMGAWSGLAARIYLTKDVNGYLCYAHASWGGKCYAFRGKGVSADIASESIPITDSSGAACVYGKNGRFTKTT